MTVGEAEIGQIVELVYRAFGQWVASGRIVRVGQPCGHDDDQVYAWERFTRRKIPIHKSTRCRTVEDAADHPSWAL